MDQAVAEARRRDAVLEIVHAWPWADYDPLAFGLTAQPGSPDRHRARPAGPGGGAGQERDPDRNVLATLTAEDAAEELLRIGRRAALIVVGTRGLGGFAGLLLGSVSLRLAAHTVRPLLVVRGGLPALGHRPAEHGRVLAGIASARDLPAARFAFEEAVRRGARLRVLHAWARPGSRPPPGPYPADDLAARAERERAMARRLVAPLRRSSGRYACVSRWSRGSGRRARRGVARGGRGRPGRTPAGPADRHATRAGHPRGPAPRVLPGRPGARGP
ncbi:universal stress protein [Streptomyces sp. M19]